MERSPRSPIQCPDDRPPSTGHAIVLCLTLALAGTLAPTALAESTRQTTEWSCRNKICLRSHQRGGYVTLQVKTQRNRAVHVIVKPQKLKNLKPLQPTPFSVRAEKGRVYDVGVLGVIDKNKPISHSASWRGLRGNPNAVHDDSWHYRMPFGGHTMRPISQGYKGRFSHKGLSAYALDFPMPWGTPILASRGGVISEVINDMVASGTRKGEFESDNRVIIEHRDGTFAVYAHLRHGGRARVGQRVRSGDLIGLSGDTGFSTGPHLHFQVHKLRADGKRQTIPVKFWNDTPRGFTPVAGLQYKPGCPRSGGVSCMPGELADEAPATAPASSRPGTGTASGSSHKRLENGACQCANGAVLHVDLPCGMVCGR